MHQRHHKGVPKASTAPIPEAWQMLGLDVAELAFRHLNIKIKFLKCKTISMTSLTNSDIIFTPSP